MECWPLLHILILIPVMGMHGWVYISSLGMSLALFTLRRKLKIAAARKHAEEAYKSNLEIDKFECFHDCWVKFIDHLSQLFLPELICILLADCDWVIIGSLKQIDNSSSPLAIVTLAALCIAVRSASLSTQHSRTAGSASGLKYNKFCAICCSS